MQFTVVLTRSLERQTNEEAVKAAIQKLINRALKGARGRAWETIVHRSPPATQGEHNLWVNSRKITFKKVRGHAGAGPKQWRQICAALIRAGQSGTAFSRHPWLVTGENSAEIYGELVEAGKVAPIASGGNDSISIKTKTGPLVKTTTKNFGEINTDPGHYFDHIYGREHQIKIIHSAVIAAKESDFVNRFHCVLQGPPGCAKTDILKSVGNMLGRENEAYMVFDATSTTEAGAQKILLESDYIPPVLICEEIEKVDEKSLRWMLGILDHRAEIRKTNFHIGHRAKNVKMLCLATVNNIKLFRKVMSGALYSRFAHSIYCPRPTRDVMEKILLREVAKVNGDVAWIEPTLKFCMDERGINDPRKIVPVCLCGRDDLLNGTYQESLLAVRQPRKKAVK